MITAVRNLTRKDSSVHYTTLRCGRFNRLLSRRPPTVYDVGCISWLQPLETWQGRIVPSTTQHWDVAGLTDCCQGDPQQFTTSAVSESRQYIMITAVGNLTRKDSSVHYTTLRCGRFNRLLSRRPPTVYDVGCIRVTSVYHDYSRWKLDKEG